MNQLSVGRILTLCILVIVLVGCKNKTQLELIPSAQTGITFTNEIKESDTLNVLTFEYIYNGAGVGIGDFNNDSLPDVFFAGNMVSSRLFLNHGEFKFEDVSTKAGIQTTGWCTGVAVVDIDQDGWLDVYVSTVHPDAKKSAANLLFRNKGAGTDGIPVFEEIAAKVGLADSSYSTQAVFLDYDLDGDLDLYLLTNALENYTRNSPIGQKTNGTGKSVDKLFRNDGLINGLPSFTDVSREAGILTEGWGLGISVSDFNFDGYPDVYAANDFLSNDHLYLNNGDGTFTNTIASALKHQEYNGMGIDVADVNNDGLQDILVVDMMPDDNLRQKTMFAATGYDRFQKNLQMNYQPQYVRNVLQLNNGNGTFSDIGYLSGVYATDWSWSALITDLDNDGMQDIMITNGYRKDITDLDFVAYSKESSHFGTDETRRKKAREAIEQIDGVKKRDVLFRNKGNLQFSNVSGEWGMTEERYGNGAAYADFDLDGDLDLVVNNINDEASVYRNNSVELDPQRSHYLRIMLSGPAGNKNGFGTKVIVYQGDSVLIREQSPQRGYQSSVEPIMHVGLGTLSSVDSVVIHWPGGRIQRLTNVETNQTIKANYIDAESASSIKTTSDPIFNDQSQRLRSLGYKHDEDEYVDFKSTPTLLRKYSQEGPALAVGDINNDGLDDLVVCGAANRSAIVFSQNRDGSFDQSALPVKQQEDAGILLFDADGDNDLDLYCVSGSSEFGDTPGSYQDRFYRNDDGAFTIELEALPVENASGSVVTAADFDRDGDLDLFVGGRLVPGKYPQAPSSFVLQNDGAGKFVNITPRLSSTLEKIGMVTAALWTDFDNDGWIDLIVAGEWMPVTFVRNEDGKSFVKVFSTEVGWWNSIAGGDFDHDGDIDYVCGNLGLNSQFQASTDLPVSLYAKDFDNNGSFDPLTSRYINGVEYLIHPRETLTDQIVGFKRSLTRYAIYGQSSREKLLGNDMLNDATILRATNFASALISNFGDGRFEVTALPVEAQTSIMNGLVVTDINQDLHPDIVAVGNSYSMDPLTGHQDAGIGTVLKGDGKGTFDWVTPVQSGFVVDRDAKALVSMHGAGGKSLWVASQNRDSLRVFEHDNGNGQWIHPGITDTRCEMITSDGQRIVKELYYGSGYLSQSSRRIFVPSTIHEIYLVNSKGEKRKLTHP